MELDWKSIVIFLNHQGQNAFQIHQEIKECFPQNSPCYSTVTRIIRLQKTGSRSNLYSFEENIQYQEENCNKILKVLKDFPFASVQQIEKIIGIPKSTIYNLLTKSLGYVARHLKWVPHFLNKEQKKKS